MKLSRNWKASPKETKRKGNFPFLTSEIIGNGAFLLNFQGENSHEILKHLAVIDQKESIFGVQKSGKGNSCYLVQFFTVNRSVNVVLNSGLGTKIIFGVFKILDSV